LWLGFLPHYAWSRWAFIIRRILDLILIMCCGKPMFSFDISLERRRRASRMTKKWLRI
jgi:hypothetical protein